MPNPESRSSSKSMRSPEHPCPNHNSVCVPRAYDHQNSVFLDVCVCVCVCVYARLTNFDVDDLPSNTACSLESCCACAIGPIVVVRLARAPANKQTEREMPRLRANSIEFSGNQLHLYSSS